VSGSPAEIGSAANNYQILGRLAVGGMAEIFLARGVSATGVERYCVLKRILRSRATDLHFLRMFLDEARLAAQLNHPNVAQVYDIGKLADSYFFTMEYVHGETVRAVIQRARSLRRELPFGAIFTVAAGAASGLHHAHDRLGFDGRPLGIVHRDVSPSNLMISYEGGVKVVDFGVAKAADRMQETRSGTVKGKISYLSPEQCRSADVDRRTDLFALGIVMWELVTGERLYRRASDFENMNAIVNEPPPPPSSRRRSVPPELDDLVMRLLAKDPAERYQTADDVVDAVEQTAAATGARISPSSLGRLLREMFGQRPEPWLETDPHDAPESVTVTSEPIPAELGASFADSLDLELAGVPDLSVQHALSPGDGIPQPVAVSSSGPAELAPPLAPPLPLAATLPEVLPQQRPARGWTMIAVILAAMVIGSLTVLLVTKSGAGGSNPDPIARAAPPDPAVAPAGPVAASIDAEAAAPPDAQVVAVADVSIDAAPAEPTKPTKPPLESALDDRRYDDAVELCSRRFSADIAAMCTLAACHARSEAKVRQWYARAPAGERQRLLNLCRGLGIDPVVRRPPPPGAKPDAVVEDKCEKDPRACQH
jgi:serine/threonine protein kinase